MTPNTCNDFKILSVAKKKITECISKTKILLGLLILLFTIPLVSITF